MNIIFLKNLKKRFIDYWFGEVLTTQHYVYDSDENKNITKKLHSISLLIGQYNKYTCFSEIQLDKVKDIVKILKTSKKKYFKLHIDFDNGIFQEHIFNKFQSKLLLQKLEAIIYGRFNKDYIEDLIKQVIIKIRFKYPNLVIDYVYDEESDIYDIWHNSEYLEFEDKEFPSFVGTLIQEVLCKNGVFNISFGYDYEKTKELKNQKEQLKYEYYKL